MIEKKNPKEIIKLTFLLLPAVSYILFEYVTGNLFSIPFSMAVLNVLWFSAVYLAVFILSGTTRIAVFTASVFFWAVSAAEAFVVSFRSTPIMIWDVLAFRTAMEVSGNYVYDFTKEMKLAGAAVAGINILFWQIPFRLKGWKKRLAWAGGGIGAIAAFLTCFFTVIIPKANMEISMWDMGETYQYYGYVLSTAISLKYVVNTPPHGYSRAKVLEIYDELADEPAQPSDISPEQDSSKASIQPVNIICIMNESFSDLKAVGDFPTNTEYFPFLNRLKENTVKGRLCVPVFGASTSNTEFEFLTGDSMAFLPAGSNAFQLYVGPRTSSIASILKDQGYATLAMHPYPGSNWNRNHAYPNMGFDRFVYGAEEGDYFADSSQLRNYVSDRANYEKIIEEVKNKEHPDDKLFIFNVTMQNHGGYDMLYDNFTQDVWLTEQYEGKYPRTDQYLSLIRESDRAFQYLTEYFNKWEEPTMIVLFGDHQPGVEDEFFDDIAGIPSGEMPLAQQIIWFETPFVIWTNYEQPAEDMGRLSSIYLSSYMLKLANLNMTPYNHFLINMSGHVPVIHPIGCFTEDGTYYRWRQVRGGECPFSDMILDYEYLVYNHILDKHTVEELFGER